MRQQLLHLMPICAVPLFTCCQLPTKKLRNPNFLTCSDDDDDDDVVVLLVTQLFVVQMDPSSIATGILTLKKLWQKPRPKNPSFLAINQCSYKPVHTNHSTAQ
jgi:hypothetical protein